MMKIADDCRLNVNQQESPKLASSPLVNSVGKDIVKRSPALSSVRPVGRGRQNSAQTADNTKNRPSSSASYRNASGAGISASTTDLNNVAIATGKTTLEVKHTMKESSNSRGDKIVEDDPGMNGETAVRGGFLLERSASSRGAAKRESYADDIKAASSPRIPSSGFGNEVKSSSRGRVSKTATPVVGTFAEADRDDSVGASSFENGSGSASARFKRAPRPRMKDHHGLQDSLSPKGLPMKRTHGKNPSLSSFTAPGNRSNSSRARGNERDDEPLSRTNTRNTAPSVSQTTASNERSADDDLDDEEAVNDEEDELRYCYCNGVSYGEMVACDNKNCPREWFHLECIGLKSLPKSAKWYCDECKENIARKGRFGSNGNGNGDK